MIGRMLGGRYQILERIGGGGMAIVYRGLDVLLHRPVSVKTLRPEYVGDAEFVRRFKREAQAAASLSHPSVVNIYDVGQDGEAQYIVMEYVDGQTLKQVIEDRAPLPAEEAVEIARQICDALTHAHEHNIIHRDVKPHNILISRAGRVKVTDFGIARAITTNTITHHSSSVLGSVHYFSPEQARGHVADAKSDVYSLGVVLYEMLTGQLPFSGETAISVALKHLQEPFVEPRKLNPDIPQSVENIVLKALIKNPEERYQSVRQMADDLERAMLLPDVPKFISRGTAMADSPTIVMAPVTDAGRPSDPPPVVSEEEEEEVARPIWKRIVAIIGWVIGVIALIGIAAIAAFYIFINVLHVKQIAMPNVVGMNIADAKTTLVNDGFPEQNIAAKYDSNSSSNVGLNQVETQSPGVGNVSADSQIILTVKSGSAQEPMPNLAGQMQQEAATQLEAMGVPSGNILTSEQSSATVPLNGVISTIPPAGSPFNTNTTQITLVISTGAQSAAVPDVTGKSLSTATSILKADGFAVGHTTSESSFTVAADQVVTQSPAPGQQAKAGSTVDLTVSSGQPAGTTITHEQIDVPLPVGTPLPATVKIVVTDATGTHTAVTTSQADPDATYPVTVTTTNAVTGQIDVYVNGQLVNSIPVPDTTGTGGNAGQPSTSGTGTASSPSGTASNGGTPAGGTSSSPSSGTTPPAGGSGTTGN